MRTRLLFALALIALPASVVAWTGPTSNPPGGNVAAPINVGTVDQLKNANIGVNGIAVFGNGIFSGSNRYLNFGAVSGSSGYGIRDNAGILEFKNSGGSWASIQSTISTLTGGPATEADTLATVTARGATTNTAVTFGAGPYTNDWFRINGSSGIYWQNWGSGFYMSDNYWIRGYNANSGVWMNSGNIGTNGGLTIGYGGAGVAAGSVIIAGNIGIGTQSPSQKVDIVGNANVSGSVIVPTLCLSGDCRSAWPTTTSIAWASVTGKPYPVNGQTWNWSGQGGQPTWLWGSNDGNNMYVWNPSNFNVNYANSAGSAGSVPWSGVTGKTGTGGGTVTAGCANLSFSGGLFVSSGTNGGCTGWDIAERYDIDGTLPVVRGLIVAYSNTTTTRSLFVSNPAPGESTSTPYTMTTANVHVATVDERDRIFGAVPTTPFNISDPGVSVKPGTQLVSLIGHVPVHMTLDGGPIAIGDPITVSSTTPGYGMKAATGGKIVGYALAPYTQANGGEAGTDMIEVFIHVEDWKPSGSLCVSDSTGETCITRAQLNALISASAGK